MKSSYRRALRLSCGIAALLTATAVSGIAAAQTVEEVIVTAQKRSENLQDVPVSVAQVSGERLDAMFSGGEDILALSARSPGLYAESSNGRVAPRFYIRGLGNTDFDLAASQPVSVIMDEVVMENVVLKSTPLFDLERVEVLRGPQGSLFGRNTTAGIVKFDTKKPTSTLQAEGTATYGSFGTATFDGGIGGPVVGDVVSARFSALLQHRDDWIDNTSTGKSDSLGGFDEQAARLQVLINASEQLTLLANIHTRSLEGTSAVFRANILTAGSNDLNSNFDREKVNFDGGGNNPQEYDASGASLNINYDFGGVTLTSITAFEKANGFSRGDIDGGSLATGPGFIPFPSDTTDSVDQLRQITQEFRIASDDPGAAVTWQTGLYVFNSTLRVTTDPGFVSASTLEHGNKAWSVFAQSTWAVSDALKLTGGLRYTQDDKDLTILAAPVASGVTKIADEEWSWDVSAMYDFSDDVSVYGRLAHGFRGPSIQGRDVAFFGFPSVAKSETIDSVEIGFKSELLDRSLRLNGAVYSYKVKDPQFTAVGGADNTVQLVNAAKGSGQGFEVDAEWRPVENLIMTLGYAYTKTEIKDGNLLVGICAACTVTDPLVTVAGSSRARVNGNPFPNAPETTLDFTARYSIPMGADGELFAFTDWSRQGKTNLFLYESREFFTDGNFEGGLKLGYARTDGAWEAALFARNITDEENIKGGIDFNNLTAFVNEPRVIGLSISAKLN